MTVSQSRRESFLSIVRRLLCRLLCADGEHPSPRPPRDIPAAFVAGEITILAEYPRELKLTKAEIVQRVARDLDARKLSTPVVFTTARVAIIRGRDRTLASVVGYVPELRDDQTKLLQFIRKVHREIARPPIQGRKPGDHGPDRGDPKQYPQTDPQQQVPERPSAEASLGRGQRAAPASASMAAGPGNAAGPGGNDVPPTRFGLRAASANWLSSSAKYIGTGGPGTRPVEIVSVPANPMGPQPWEFTMPAGLDRPGPTETTRQVEVAVLDTVPSIAALATAHANRVVNGSSPHPLLELLLGSAGGAFNVIDRTLTTSSPGTVDQIEVWYSPAIAPVILAEHDYTMSSHGLFVAGVIRSIAPQVKLRLIQVLNDDGGGSLQNLLDGFELLSDREDDTPLLVNCSLVLNVTEEGVDLQQLMQDIFAIVNQSNVAIIAAAGNQGNIAQGTHPDAEAPAIYDTVTGVSALNQDNTTPAAYTNISDTPITKGFAAFGGEISLGSSPLMAHPSKGILGAYIDDLPGSLPNSSGWVRWAGTSFATPIVTAALANMLCRENNTGDALGAVGDLISLMPSGANGETVSVTQG
jgi:hypothetical protein